MDEIEVTPEMVEAGLDYVFHVHGDWPTTLAAARPFLVEVFKAMRALERDDDTWRDFAAADDLSRR